MNCVMKLVHIFNAIRTHIKKKPIFWAIIAILVIITTALAILIWHLLNTNNDFKNVHDDTLEETANSNISDCARLLYRFKNGTQIYGCTAYPSSTNAFVTAGHCLDLSQQPNVTLVAVHITTSRGLIKIPASNIKFFLHNKINLEKRENDLGKFEITTDNFAADIHPYNLITSEIDLPEVVKIELWKSDEPGDFRIEIFKVKTLNMKICRSRFEGAPSVQKAIDRAERGEILPFMCLDIKIKQGNSGGPIQTSLGVLSTNSLGGSNGTNRPTLCVKHPSNYQDDNIWTEIHLN